MEKNYETLRITFNKPLTEIDKEFEEEKEMFGAESLKEFIDGYESSRFTQISETEAIITSEYSDFSGSASAICLNQVLVCEASLASFLYFKTSFLTVSLSSSPVG